MKNYRVHPSHWLISTQVIWIYETYTSKASFEKHGKIYTKKVHAELEALLTGPPDDIVMKPAAIHKGSTQRLI